MPFHFSAPSHRCLLAVSAGLTLLLAACSSKYDWQAFSDDAGQYTASFPAKPELDAQNIEVNGVSLPMRTQTASTDDGVFAIGAVALPSADPVLRDATLASIEQGIARNSGRIGASLPITVTTSSGQKFSGHEWRAEGTLAGTGQKRSVVARFVATDKQVYELVIVGENVPPQKQLAHFFDAFQPR